VSKGQSRDQDQADPAADPAPGRVETDRSAAEKAVEVAAEKEESGAETVV
jgi:hypothetical protein